MSLNANMVKNVMKIRAYGKPFYASDLGMNGGEICGLSVHSYIMPTGNTKTIMVPIDTWGGDRIFKECKVKEWRYNPSPSAYLRSIWEQEFAKAVKDAKEVLAAAAALGIEGF